MEPEGLLHSSCYLLFVVVVVVTYLQVYADVNFKRQAATIKVDERNKLRIMKAPGNDGIASMPEQVKRPNPWRMMMMKAHKCKTSFKQTNKSHF